MGLLTVIYILVFLVFALILYAVMQLKLLGIKVKDFWDFRSKPNARQAK